MLLSKEKNPKMEEIRKFIPVSTASDFDTIAPHINNAERDYLIPVIGQETYSDLLRWYAGEFYGSGSSSGTPDPDKTQWDELLLLVQASVAHIAFWIGFDLINSYITDDGFKRVESEKVKSLFKYQEDALKKYFRTNGFNGLDTVLQYLENNIEAFPKFAVSDQYTVLKSSFIPNTAVFNKIVFISNSRLTFLRMIPHMQLIEETDIRLVMGEVALAELKDEMVKDNPNTTKTAVVPLVQKAIAFLASAMLMEESGADLLDNGLYFTANIAISNNDTEKKPASTDRIASLVRRNRNFGNAYLDQIRSYLVAHAADWSDVAISTGKVLRRDNTDKKTFWA
jgi:hypothetical protein